VQVFLGKFVSKFEHRCRHFEQYSAARLRFRDVLPSERWPPKRLLTTTLCYGCSLAILFWAKHAPNSAMIALKIVKWKIAWKKWILLTLWRMQSQLQVFLLAANFELDRMTSHKHGLAAKTVSKWRPPKSIFQDEFLLDSGHFGGWNFGEWKSWMFTCYRRRLKK